MVLIKIEKCLIKMLVAIVLLMTNGYISVQAGTEISIDQKGLTVIITNGFTGCFSVKNISSDIEDNHVRIGFDYTDYDLEYELEQHNPLVESSACLCNLRDPTTKGRYIVFPHVNSALKDVRHGTDPYYGNLNNIPDMEKFSSLQNPGSGLSFDNLPKHENISFPLKYMDGKLARYYYVQLYCN